tara:strand:+ start:3881 stop:5869 length:1989 start_codon:yes stop_codon:yes gene_type:complete
MIIDQILQTKSFQRFHLFVLLLFPQLIAHSVSAQIRSEVHWEKGRPSLIIDGEHYPPFAYMSYLGEEEYYEEIAATGLHLYNLPVYLGEGGINTISGIGAFRNSIWRGENEYDFSSIEVDFEKILNADPKAKVVIRFYLDPPRWWTLANPSAAAQLPDGTLFRQSFASAEWREKTSVAFEDCLDWLLKSKYRNHLAGIHVASGFTEEWFYHPKQYQDQNPVRLQAFRDWLKNKYITVSALRTAWHNSSVTFDKAQLTNIDEPVNKIEWRDPNKDQNYIDTYRFHTEVMVDNIAYFCKIVKEKSDGKLLTGAFYGYHYFVTDPRRGHGSLAKLLNCPDLDYLSSPNVYNRAIGEDWPPMVAVNSVHKHGKLWLAENDTRTSKTTLLKDQSDGIAPSGQYEDGVWLGPNSLQTSVALLWKNAARMLTYGYGGWWFDMWGGWFSDPEMLQVLEKTQQFHQDYPSENPEIMKPSVLVIVDEELSFWDKSYGRLAEKILSNRYPIAKTGSAYDLYLRTDLQEIAHSQYQVIWLMGLLQLTDKETALIKRWQKMGKTVMWTSNKGTKLNYPEKAAEFLPGKLQWKPSELKKIWTEAGVHQYISSEDICYVGRNWLSLHSVDGGEKNIQLPYYAQVIDPLTNKVLSDSTNQINIKMDAISTVIFRVNPF